MGTSISKADTSAALLYLSVTAVFGGTVFYKARKKKMEKANTFVCGLLLLSLEILCFAMLRSYAGLLLFSGACLISYICLPVRSMLPVDNKAVLITGSDSGIGHALAKHLDNLGFVVFAGVLNKEGPGAEALKRSCSQRLSVLQMDITNPTQIREAYLAVSEKVQNAGLWGIINNAGVLGFTADSELLPMSVYRQCMDVNFFGAVEVSKMFLPLLRKSQGRLVNMSSMAGGVPMPRLSAYGASKAALSMFSGVMRQELSKWGIKVAVVHPSGFRTCIQGTPELWDKQEKHLMENLMPDVKTDYGEDYILALKNFLLHMPSSCSSDLSPLLDDVLDALLAKSPHGLYTPGKNAYLALCIFCYFPLWFYDFFIGKSLCVKILPRALRGPDSKSKNT
ncbi:17-beta-hydroxysteroid dehydrogenase type 2 isoform X1 [Alligator mississippiensis]|uniref:17-beta-hydroxysteroid dehydrogenase type 2 isoform X1 n=1 Tax=Alligator mississippiensis TaxID=8496 RepID=UPI00090742C9|nr:17-beta-hydroxysteroid dehydrogenase type 2 isoform X1 [Alligator mississippiensis]